MLIEYLKVLILGIVEGITEWLPISSTGHMILVENFLRLDVSRDFWEMFLVVIQLGAIMAVVVIYFHKLNPFSPRKSAKEKSDTWQIWGKVIIACQQRSSACRSTTGSTSISTTTSSSPSPSSSMVSSSSGSKRDTTINQPSRILTR